MPDKERYIATLKTKQDPEHLSWAYPHSSLWRDTPEEAVEALRKLFEMTEEGMDKIPEGLMLARQIMGWEPDGKYMTVRVLSTEPDRFRPPLSYIASEIDTPFGVFIRNQYGTEAEFRRGLYNSVREDKGLEALATSEFDDHPEVYADALAAISSEQLVEAGWEPEEGSSTVH